MATEVSPGTTFAGFRVDSLAGRGAMAAVYRARNEENGSLVALKLLDASRQRFRERFLRESELASSLEHPHVVRTLSAGEEDGQLYLAMEYIDGLDLRQLLRRDGRLEPERAVGIVEQAGAALDVAHKRGLVHRDVKPGNILVREDEDGEHAYVCDFGLARHVSSVSSLTGDRGFVGTIDYVSPEQIEGAPVDARADVYSLGCVLYECLTGVRPYDRDSELAVVFAHLNEPPPKATDVRPELPAAFDDVFANALAKSRDERYSSCGELAAAARAALQGKVHCAAPSEAATDRARRCDGGCRRRRDRRDPADAVLPKGARDHLGDTHRRSTPRRKRCRARAPLGRSAASSACRRLRTTRC